MDLSNTYQRFPRLAAALAPLVRRQRRLATKLAPLAGLTDEDKAVRGQIDALLLAEGFTSNQGVTCLGYDVKHHERRGQTSWDEALLTQALLGYGLTLEQISQAIAVATTTGDPSRYATVAPMKGAKVRAA